VHADDLAGAALAALDAPGAADRAFDLPGGETLSYRAMVERIFEGMGRRPADRQPARPRSGAPASR
jgi:nucleoside-diphosphate-sugar epimerase